MLVYLSPYTMTDEQTLKALAKLAKVEAKFDVCPIFQRGKRLEKPDVVLFDGGADISPFLYRKNPNNQIHSVHLGRDLAELFMFETLEKMFPDEIKYSGICRGVQFLSAVMLDLPLIKDLESIKKSHSHRHSVQTMPDTILSYLIPSPYTVNSLHHQAVDVPDDRLEIVSAIEPETNVIEAIETDRFRGVQWHPELMGDGNIFKYLLWSEEE